ncbi:3-hydroxyisobutyrate dehydrogenase [bacterium]|nr:MAG: 3-hydroxyisobutyrate dehydrogenase [bacterium]
MSDTQKLNIGIIGTGYIGKTLVRKLSAAGHTVLFANSRGPETLQDLAAETGATAVTAAEAVQGADVVITSIPFEKSASLRPILSAVPADVPVIDTSNYYPQRDGRIPAVEEGQVESLWVQEQFGHPVVKAWNNIGAGSFEHEGLPAGAEGRMALSVAGDDSKAKQVAMDLVETTGFDAIDGGTLEESWRQQPGTPGYCVDFQAEALKHALLTAVCEEAPHRRDLVLKELEKLNGNFNTADLVRLNRLIVTI